ncbi:MAG TPA: nicotinate-nucleotide--dimethylbenzimidazole phosphoribosyltransferase [Acidimicrobiia bacterium]
MALDLGRLPKPDVQSGAAVRERAQNVLRPTGALARLDELAVWLAQWQRTATPSVDRPAALLFAGDHGVVVEGVSAYPSEVTRSMVDALRSGKATASVMAHQLDVDLHIHDAGVGRPTGNIKVEAAMTADEFDVTFGQGREAVAALDTDLLILGEMGIGNTTTAAAVATALLGRPAAEMVGPGTGLDGPAIEAKTRVVTAAVERAGSVEPMEILRELGGRELVAMAGAALEARRRSIPTLLDGYVVTAALMTLELTGRGALAHCWPAHLSPEPGHARLLELLGRRPILDLEMRLGEGSGALAALPLVRLAATCVVDVATFAEWGH